MPRDTARELAHAARVRWLFTLLYLGGLRIAEVSANAMGQFFVRRDADGAMRWWVTVHGKGGKERLVPATREMMTELSRYRQHLGLTALPTSHEDTPLVLPIGATAGNGGTQTCAPLTRAALHAIVKDVFAGAAARLRERDEICFVDDDELIPAHRRRPAPSGDRGEAPDRLVTTLRGGARSVAC